MRQGLIALMASLVLLVSSALPAIAATEPYQEDPLGVVPFRDSIQSAYTQGLDTWEVWVCDVPDWDVALDADDITAELNASLGPYFEWLSAARYRPVFQVGGTVSSNDTIANGEFLQLFGCETKIADLSAGTTNGVLIVADGGYGGYATLGRPCLPHFAECSTTFGFTGRRAVVGASALAVLPPYPEKQLNVVAHEIGHTFGWAHSFGGLVARPDGPVNEYDNIVDVMSGWEIEGDPIGTHAYNRYAAGWIDPSEVAFFTGGTSTFALEPIGGSGVEMVSVMLEEGYAYSLGLRTALAYDSDLAEAGVEAYLVDTRPTACVQVSGWPTYPCWGSSARVSPSPAPTSTTDTTHVRSVGETFSVGVYSATVIAGADGGIFLRLSDGLYVGRFVDDDGNVHEPNIEAIAAIGLTKGCDPPSNDRYCPSSLVSRAEMATFLLRALGVSADGWVHQGYFGDVPADSWFAPYVERLFELGITTGYGDGTFRPYGSVSRAEMAVFVARAFQLAVSAPTGGVFEDVAPDVWFAAEAEALYAEGISSGCSASPLLYCPSDLVPRDQMASFLARALGIGG